MSRPLALLLFPVVAMAACPAQAKMVCTVIADAADGRVLLEDGDCTTQVTPASTFKIALSLMGFDSGFLTDDHAPALPFREGYPDWGGDNWRQPTDASRWMKYSVVWFSQRITEALGAERFADYVAAFDYGNADVSGDPGKNNGLERSWISSSLKISPREQVDFLRRLLNRDLPVTTAAYDMTERVVETSGFGDGGKAQGKTGSAAPRKADGSFDLAKRWGWYVGWTRLEDRTLVFARLDQDERREKGPGGIRARQAFLAELPDLLRTVAD